MTRTRLRFFCWISQTSSELPICKVSQLMLMNASDHLTFSMDTTIGLETPVNKSAAKILLVLFSVCRNICRIFTVTIITVLNLISPFECSRYSIRNAFAVAKFFNGVAYIFYIISPIGKISALHMPHISHISVNFRLHRRKHHVWINSKKES